MAANGSTEFQMASEVQYSTVLYNWRNYILYFVSYVQKAKFLQKNDNRIQLNVIDFATPVFFSFDLVWFSYVRTCTECTLVNNSST